jgi:hypothetical protein
MGIALLVSTPPCNPLEEDSTVLKYAAIKANRVLSTTEKLTTHRLTGNKQTSSVLFAHNSYIVFNEDVSSTDDKEPSIISGLVLPHYGLLETVMQLIQLVMPITYIVNTTVTLCR